MILYSSVAQSSLSPRGRHLCYLAMRVMRESVGGANGRVEVGVDLLLWGWGCVDSRAGTSLTEPSASTTVFVSSLNPPPR